MAFSAPISSEGGNPSCGPITFKLRTIFLDESPHKSLKLEITPSIPEADANGLLDRLHAQLSSEGKELLLTLKESDDAFHFEIEPVLKDNTKSVTSKPSRFETEFINNQPIGKGGFGRVYKGKHSTDGAVYAVKKIRVNGPEDKQLREVQTLSVVNHKHVVRYYNSWLEKGPVDLDSSSEADSVEADQSSNDDHIKEWLYLYIQMEHCSRTLHDMLLNSPPSSDTRLKLFRQILKGLVCIHGNNIIHRDLNPNNIFLDRNDNIKIGDFGLATFCKDGGAVPNSLYVGVPLYNAPEIARKDSKVDMKVDIYSLGIIYFELCCYPMGSDTERNTVVSNFINHGRLPVDWKAEEQVGLLRKMTSANAIDRPSAAELLQLIGP